MAMERSVLYSVESHYITLHYSYLDWPNYQTAKPLYMLYCRELETENS